jgi:hypothetical protein
MSDPRSPTPAEYWRTAADDLRITVVAPFELVLPSGGRIHADVLVRSFGAAEGMLIVTESAAVWPFRDEIVQLGYGFSVMDPPGGPYDPDNVREVLEDWGWSCDDSDCPAWLRGG